MENSKLAYKIFKKSDTRELNLSKVRNMGREI